MLFHTQEFILIFLPAVVALYYLAARHERRRTWLLIAGSLVFYGYWDVRLLPLLVGSVSANWLLARLMARGVGRWLVPAGVTLNLVLLSIFKYADFFADTLSQLVGGAHQPWSIVLPLGISFFTFQQISYLADLGRGRAPAYRFDQYAMYVTFFPQLIAGPIVRHNEIIHQFALSPLREGFDERMARGLVIFVIGVVKKAFIADRLAAVADPLFARAAAGEALGFSEVWAAAGAFGMQIYFDFSGYSDMAIGLALLFGFTLPANFNAPYKASSIREFWRRWHMTLSRFLRDYLYVPLGGSRFGFARQLAAVMITMLLGGLWHGAGWNFVAWGGLHGLAIAVNHVWHRAGARLPWLAGWALTMLFVFVCWVLFRAEGFAAASSMLASMFGGAGWSMVVAGTDESWFIAVAAAVALLGMTSQRIALEALAPRRSAAVLAGAVLAYMIFHVGTVAEMEFIYFQF